MYGATFCSTVQEETFSRLICKKEKKDLIFILNKTKFIYILLPDEDGVGIDSDMMIYVGDYISTFPFIYFENLYYKA